MTASVKSGSDARAIWPAANPAPAARRIVNPNLRRVISRRSRPLSWLLRIIFRFFKPGQAVNPGARESFGAALANSHIVAGELRGRHAAGRASHLLRGFT